jgi:signal transduction histidine kinase
MISVQPPSPGERRLASWVVAVSAVVFAAAIPFARQPLAPLPAFVPVYQSALVVNDLMTAILLFGQFGILRVRALLFLASGYLFTAAMAAMHMLSFPGLFAPAGLLGAGPQTTAWLYMFWHAGFPLLVIAYALDRHSSARAPRAAMVQASVVALMAAGALALLATEGQTLLPAIMQGNRYTPAMILVVSSVWTLSGAALFFLWRRPPHSLLDLWLMVAMCAWVFDIGLAAVFNAGRFDLGFYAGRIYGLLAATFVLVLLLLENTALYARLAEDVRRRELAARRLAERLRILHEIDRAVVAEKPAEAIAAAVIQPLRELLGVPRAVVNRFDLPQGEVEWVAAAGRRRTHVGPGVRYSLRLMGDLEALRRGEPQRIDVRALEPGVERDALLASGVQAYLAVPMVAGGELIGALSFGGESSDFAAESVGIAQEVAAQLAIAMMQARLLERVRSHADELERRVAVRTAELAAANRELEAFSYSVSHDLRAPLRAVDGYARMLEEDYGGRLDEEGRRLLGVVRSSSRQMGQLIDDLLAFSRLGRQAPAKRPVDMTHLAREAVRELTCDSGGHAIDISPLPATSADPALLRQVWLNLVGNALKYSAGRDAARVEIGGRKDGSESVYWVRDNGVGFDMRYADKLFRVFQRLHRAEEFPGTGVGLAIVERVVTRHGGRVWAEAELGMGAAFYFALPQ